MNQSFVRFCSPGNVMHRRPLVAALAWIVVVSALAGSAGFAASKAVIDTSASPHVKFRTIDLDAARWTGGFWGDRWELNRKVTVPTMKRVLELPDNSATFHNLRVAAGLVPGKFNGNNWSDGDCYKWIEAAASVYALTRDPELDRQMDEVIAVMGYSMRTDRYRFTAWVDRRNPQGEPFAVELYDHERDPHELTNLAIQPESHALVARLRAEWLSAR